MEDLFNNDKAQPHTYENMNEDLLNRGFSSPSLLQVCILYSITVILFSFIGYRVQGAEFYSGILITEFIIVALPPIILLLLYKYDFKKVLRLHRVSILNLFLILLIMVFAMPLVGALNLVNLVIIESIFGKIAVSQLPIAENYLELLLNILVIAGSAGICEELMFRGVIQRGFERMGITRAILITAFLFGLMHADFQKLLGTFLLGALIGFIVYRTNSLFSGMFAHFTNNAISVLLSFAANSVMKAAEKSGIQGLDQTASTSLDFSAILNLPKTQLIAVLVVYAFVFIFFLGSFIALMIAFIQTTKHKVEPRGFRKEPIHMHHLLWLLPGVAVIGIIYFAEGLMMKGLNLGWVNSFLWLIGAR